MRTTKSIHVISAHAEGEVGDVIVGCVLPLLLHCSCIAAAVLLLRCRCGTRVVSVGWQRCCAAADAECAYAVATNPAHERHVLDELRQVQSSPSMLRVLVLAEAREIEGLTVDQEAPLWARLDRSDACSSSSSTVHTAAAVRQRHCRVHRQREW